jgi:acyl-CoA synthetase (AMP-forming)/AMP-acid ligase II
VSGAASQNTVRGLIDRQASLRPEALVALATESPQQLSYAGLLANCARVATLLQAHGCKPGDTVSLVMPNGLGTLQLLLGAMYGGWCVNPVNLLSQAEQMHYVLEHSDCTLILASGEWVEKVRALAPRAPVLAVDHEQLALPEQASPTQAPDADATALLMYTSGTTGRPKGVMLTQANLAANAQAIAAEHQLSAADRVLGVLPLYHINAFAVTMLAPLASGGSVAMTPRFSAARFWLQVIETRCTWLNFVPTIASYLIEGPEAPPREALGAVRFARSASAALPPEHLLAFEQRFGIGIIETMGLTETVAPSFSNPLDAARRKLGSVGRASGCEARVIDGALQPVPDGQTGEIAIRGPNVMRGYYKNEAATTETFTPDGWLRTGDLGHRDADGFFFVTGRIKELIIKGGENIAPREIDEALLRHAAVLEAAAVGMPDRHYGQEILACVVLRPGIEAATVEAELRAFCEQHLGRYKTPKQFRFVAELPRGPSGKVQRLKLLDLG